MDRQPQLLLERRGAADVVFMVMGEDHLPDFRVGPAPFDELAGGGRGSCIDEVAAVSPGGDFVPGLAEQAPAMRRRVMAP